LTRARLLFLGAVALLVMFALGASLARASAWEAFVERCVDPMSDFQHADTSDLVTYTATGWAADLLDVVGETGSESFALPGENAVLNISEDRCAISVAAVSPALRHEVTRWRDQAVAEGLFEQAEGRWLSTEWREPKLAIYVTWIPETSHAVFLAEDTDLES